MTKIEFLQVSAKNWFGNSQQHSIHAQLLKARGLNKLADLISAESDEEYQPRQNPDVFPGCPGHHTKAPC